MSSLVSAVSTAVSMTSREIATLSGKRHDNVIRDIDNLLKTLASGLSSGFSMAYEGDPAYNYRYYTLDRDAAYCLVAGYDPNARMRIIQRWQELESKQAPQTYLSALKALVAAEEAKAEIEERLERERPYTEVGHLVSSLDVITRRDWVGLMKNDWGVKIKERELNRFLRENKYIYDDPIDRHPRAYAQYDRYFKLVYESINGRTIAVLKVTGMGVLELTPIVVRHFA